jgi:hypothetical protein
MKALTPKNMEALIPPPLAKSLTKNFQFLDTLLNKGKSQPVHYQSFFQTSEIITIYFHEKYKQSCPMYPIIYFDQLDMEIKRRPQLAHYPKEELYEKWIKIHKNIYTKWDQAKFLKNLKLCLETGEELIMIPLHNPGHLNMVIIKASTREIILFEPHGHVYKGAIHRDVIGGLYDFLEKLTTTINEYLNLNNNKKFTFVDPSKICPRYNNLNRPSDFYQGFQELDKAGVAATDKSSGFCQLWSWFFAECVMNNPHMDVREVYKEAYDFLKTDETQFATVIRGYFLDINDELVKMNKAFSIKKEYLAKNKIDDLLLDYLKQSQNNIRNKPRKPFVGGLKNKKFILPPINPKVEPVIF